MIRHPKAWSAVRAAPVACALAAMALAAVALCGWLFDIGLLRTVTPGWAATQPLTALSLLLSGLGLAAAARLRAARGMRSIAGLAALAVLVLSSASLIQDLSSVDLGVDRLLFPELVTRQPLPDPGRMSVATALSLLLFSLALLTGAWTRPNRVLYVGAALAGLSVALIGMFGHLFNPGALYSVPPFRTMGILTALGLTALHVGLLAARPNYSLIRVLARDSLGGAMARVSLPRLMLAPVLLMGVVYAVCTAFGLDRDFRLATFTAAATVMLGALALHTAKRMDRIDHERRRADAARRESEEWLTNTVQLASVGMAHIGFDGRWQRVNPHLCAITGYGQAELMRLTPRDITHPDDRQRDAEAMARLRTGRMDRYVTEKRYVRKDGEVVWVALTVTLVRDHVTGAPRHCLAVIEDIDRRKKADWALRNRTERLALISHVTGRLLHDGDVSGLLYDVFPRLGAIMDVDAFVHYTAEGSSLQLAAFAGVPPEAVARISQLAFGEAVCGTVAAEGTPIVFEDVPNQSDPRTALIRTLGFTAYACYPLQAGGRLFGTISFGSLRRASFTAETLTVMRTICDQVAIALVRRHEEQELRAAKEEAEKAMVAKAKFLAAASHDLRQPVQSLMLLNSAMTGWVDGKAAALKLLDHQNLALGALKDLLDGLLDIARLDAGAVAPEIGEVPVMTLFQRLQAAYAPRIEARRLRFRVVPSNAWIRTDVTLLGRILSNFLENALKYTSAGTILVGCRHRGDRLSIVVADTGIGIAPEHRDEIFEEFAQINNPHRDRALGLGLGLAIVKRLSALLGHPVHVRSAPGKGSLFWVDVPLVRAKEEPAARPAVPSNDDGQDRGVIVLIDDEVMIRTAMEASLAAWGYEVHCGSTADEALAVLAAEHRRPDVVVSDYHIAEGTGVQVIERVRASYGRDLPCILLTGDTAPERLSDARHHGFLLLQKPTTPGELRAAIRRVRGGEGADATTLRLASSSHSG